MIKLTHADWRALQWPVTLFVLTLAGVGSLWQWSDSRRDEAEAQLQTQRNQLTQARQKFQASGEEKDIITQSLPRYQALIRQGFIGEERRIEWIDALRTLNRQYKLFGIRYSIDAQITAKLPFPPEPAPFTLHQSAMHLEMPLLHEGDLLTVLGGLAQTPITPHLPRDCILTRATAASKNRFVPNLNATCELHWLTLAEPTSAGLHTGGTP